jgi:type IV conjugative transfer system coupling protein TraD
MFAQVFNTLLLWSCLMGVGAFGLESYSVVTQTEVASVVDYYKAKAMMAIGMKNKKLIVAVDGVKYQVTPATCIQLPYFQGVKKSVEQKLAKSFVLGYGVWLISFTLLSIVFVARGLKKSGEQFSRGAKLSIFNEIKKTIEACNKKSGVTCTYTIAGMPYLHLTEMEHTLVIGTTGVGKTVLISDLVEQIRARGDKAIIYDKKCDYIKWFYDPSRDFILNPFDTRGEKWNLVKEIENIAHIKSIAESFIPDRSTYGEKMWDEAARLAFSGILEKLVCTENDITNEQIVDLLLKQDVEAVSKLVKGTYAQGTIDPNSPKTAASVIFVLATHFNSLRLTRGSFKESFSIKKWIQNKDRDSILFISSEETLSGELAPLQTAWFEIAITGILSSKDGRAKTWVILDELPTLHKIPSLSKALSVSRSYGGCFVLGMQNISQVREIYGKNITESISSDCNTRAMFKVNDPGTAAWISKNIGEVETLEYKEGVSYGANTMRDGVNVHSQEKLKSLILPSEIQNLPKLNLLLKTSGFGTVKTSIAYRSRIIKAEPFIYSSTITDEMHKSYKNKPPALLKPFKDERNAKDTEKENLMEADLNVF